MSGIDWEVVAQAALEDVNILDIDTQKQFRCSVKEKRGKRYAHHNKGNFCMAFPMTGKSNPKAKLCYRVWYKEDYEERKYKEICLLVSKMIRSLNLPYLTDYQYIHEAIRIKDTILPGVKMEWIDALPLDEWLKNHKDKAAIKKLAGNFMQMCKDFRAAGISHGDLANTNILINEQGEIFLIDYDSFYVPEMKNDFYQTTAGQAAFQHYKRINPESRLKATPNDDNFSQQVIYLSLLGMAHDTNLIDKICEDELIFNNVDLKSASDFVKSDAYKRLREMNDREIAIRLEELKLAIEGDLSSVRSIVDISVQAVPVHNTHHPKAESPRPSSPKPVKLPPEVIEKLLTEFYNKYPDISDSVMRDIFNEYMHRPMTQEEEDIWEKVKLDKWVNDFIKEAPAAVSPKAEPVPKLSEYCHTCGRKYTNNTDKFCIKCGTKRLEKRNN